MNIRTRDSINKIEKDYNFLIFEKGRLSQALRKELGDKKFFKVFGDILKECENDMEKYNIYNQNLDWEFVEKE